MSIINFNLYEIILLNSLKQREKGAFKMKFAEKIRKLRKERKMSQADLAKAIGVSPRTIQNYEITGAYPKKREIYKQLADFFEVEINYLLTEDEEFIVEAKEQYGNRGANDAVKIINQVPGLFAGGDVDEDTKDEVMKAIQNAYWQAKEINKKHTPKKYLQDN